jgi:putative ABC transport system permease protein
MKKDWIEKGLSKPKNFSLSQAQQNKLQDFLKPYEKDIDFSAPLFLGVGLISNGCRSVPFYLTGLPPELKKWIRANPEYNRWTTKSDKTFLGRSFDAFSRDEMPLMVTENLARLLNKNSIYTSPASLPPLYLTDCSSIAGKAQASADPSVQLMTKTLDGGITAIDANVVGHFTYGFAFLDDMGLQGPLSLAQKLYDTDAISRLVLYLRDAKLISEWKKQVLPAFERQFPDLEMIFYDNQRISPFYVGTASFLDSLSFFFVVIAGLAIALAIINSLTINIMERSKEIGTLRALGFNESQMAWLFGREMTLLTLASLVSGILLTKLLAVLINRTNIQFEPPGSSGSIQLEIALDPRFQFLAFIALSLLVAGMSFWLSKRRIKTNIAHLLIET